MIPRPQTRSEMALALHTPNTRYGVGRAWLVAIGLVLVWRTLAGGQGDATAAEQLTAAPQSTRTAPSPTTAVTPVNAPHQGQLVSLPPYVIEPPDLLTIAIHEFDDVNVDATNPQEKPGAEAECHEHVIRAEYLVAPNGGVDLGKYGKVNLSGMTLAQARVAIGEHLKQVRAQTAAARPEKRCPDELAVDVDLHTSNSKFYYIITEGTAAGDQITRVPINNQETVLDGIAQIGGLPKQCSKRIWVARPAMSDGSRPAQMLPVDWNAILRGDGSTNWQLFPGDRLFLAQLSWVDLIEAGAALLRGESAEQRPLPLPLDDQEGKRPANPRNADDQTVDTKDN